MLNIYYTGNRLFVVVYFSCHRCDRHLFVKNDDTKTNKANHSSCI